MLLTLLPDSPALFCDVEMSHKLHAPRGIISGAHLWLVWWGDPMAQVTRPNFWGAGLFRVFVAGEIWGVDLEWTEMKHVALFFRRTSLRIPKDPSMEGWKNHEKPVLPGLFSLGPQNSHWIEGSGLLGMQKLWKKIIQLQTV